MLVGNEEVIDPNGDVKATLDVDVEAGICIGSDETDF